MPEGLCNIWDWLCALIRGNKNKGHRRSADYADYADYLVEKQRGQGRSADYADCADGLAGNKG